MFPYTAKGASLPDTFPILTYPLPLTNNPFGLTVKLPLIIWLSVNAFPKLAPVLVTWNSVPLVITANEPVILIDPVNWWVLAVNDPKRVDPVTKSIDEVIVCTTNVCAVNVFATVNVFANEAVAAVVAFTAYEAVVVFTAYEAVVAFTAYDAVVVLVAYDDDAIEPDTVIPPVDVILPDTVILPDKTRLPDNDMGILWYSY